MNNMSTNYPLIPENMILLVEVGSTAHGTGIPGGEDHDETAVVIEPPERVMGLRGELRNSMQRTQPEGKRSGPGDTDRQVYSLRKFLSLSASGNPSVMLVLWAPVIAATPLGQDLRDLAPCFVGRHIVPRYRGYMMSQVMRMQGLKASGHGKRGGGKREELIATHGYDTKYAMHAARLGYQCIELLETGCLTLPISGSPGDWLRTVRYGEVEYDEWLSVIQKLDRLLGDLVDEDLYPEGPDLKTIEAFSIRAHRETWGWS